MIEIIKEIIGITVTDYDVYLAVICAVGVIWIAKSVITGIYNAVLHIFL